MSSGAFRGAGSVLSVDDGGGVSFTAIAELKSIEPSGAKADLDDTTNLDSAGAYREFLPTLLDGGEITLSGNYLGNASTSQSNLLTLFNNQSLRTFKIVLVSAKGTWTFQGYIVEPPYPKVTFDKAVQFTAKIKITGQPTFA